MGNQPEDGASSHKAIVPLSREAKTRFLTIGGSGEPPMVFTCGRSLGPIKVAYETYGQLNSSASNAVLVFHALSGSQHAAGINRSVHGAESFWNEDCYVGWWDSFIGPGKALDTDRYFVICANYLGGCYGSTGPSSLDPITGVPFGSTFPQVSVSDIVDSQKRLLSYLGIERLHALVGPSLGAMLALNFATRYPSSVEKVVIVSGGLEVTTLQRLLRFEQIRAIEADQNFRGGDYYDGPYPEAGLALARMIAHKTYISLHALEQRARTEVTQDADVGRFYKLSHPVESYMLHQGRKFVRRFDANTYLRIADAWQRSDLLGETGASSYEELFSRCRQQRFLVFTINSDVCFYPDEQTALAQTLKKSRVHCNQITVHSDKGHDAFLLEPELFSPYLSFELEQ